MSNINIWEIIDKESSLYPTDFGNGVLDKKSIDIAETALRVKFSESYRKFLSLYGCGMFIGHFVYGLEKQRSMPDINWSVIDRTKFYKEDQRWPGIEDWYIISDDGRGNPIGVDPNGVVWLSDHDAGFKKIKLANDFEEFIHKLLTDTLYE